MHQFSSQRVGISDGELALYGELMEAPLGLRQGSSGTGGVWFPSSLVEGVGALFSFRGLCPHSLELSELAVFSDFSLFLASRSLCSWLRKQIYSVDQTRRNR